MRKLAPWLLVSIIYTFAFPQHHLFAAQLYNPESVLTFAYDPDLIAYYDQLAERHSRFVRVNMTGYSSTVDQTDSSPFITASNSRVRPGIVATNFLPFGARIRIPEYYGDQVFIVEDRMNRRYTTRVDIWFPTRWEALQFGLRTTTIEILD